MHRVVLKYKWDDCHANISIMTVMMGVLYQGG